jgi:hypothetical protein
MIRLAAPALLALAAAGTAALLAGDPDPRPAPAALRPAAAPEPPAAPDLGWVPRHVALDPDAAAALFGMVPERLPALDPADVIGDAIPAPPEVRLIGIFLSGPARSALIAVAGEGRPRWRRIGEEVGGRAITAIEPGRVILAGAEALELRRPAPAEGEE